MADEPQRGHVDHRPLNAITKDFLEDVETEEVISEFEVKIDEEAQNLMEDEHGNWVPGEPEPFYDWKYYLGRLVSKVREGCGKVMRRG